MSECGCGLCKEYISKTNVVCDYKYSFLMFNKYPYLCGHLLLVPKRAVPSLGDLTAEERVEILDKIIEAQEIVIGALGPSEFGVTSVNIGINFGPHSGASIPTHLHIHIVPRRPNDTNFMHTCMFSGETNETATQRNPKMFSGLYENARKLILDYVKTKTE